MYGNHSENSETQKRRMKDSNLQVELTTECLANISTAFVGIRRIVYLKTTSVCLLFRLHIHQYRKCVFTELSLPIKQVP